MAKSYFNNGIIGNSGMLGCISDKGELIRLFWPHIDYPQHIDSFNVGIYEKDRRGSTCWLDSSCRPVGQKYVGDTNILETHYVSEDGRFSAIQSDFAVPGRDIMVRHYSVKNTSSAIQSLGFTAYSSMISTNPQLAGTIYDSRLNTLIHYRNDYYVSISASFGTVQFQLGNDAFSGASDAMLHGFDTMGMMNDGALMWEAASIEPGGCFQFAIYICAAHTLKDIKRLAAAASASDPAELHAMTADYWRKYIDGARKIDTGREDIVSLYNRTLLVFKLMSDEKTGGLLASPEIDEGFTMCGRYAYCWGRDAAFITGAMDKCGLAEEVELFYNWASEVQDEEGSWQQRYQLDGNLAPSWGIQIDETGTILWGILKHYRESGSKGFLVKMWDTVRKGANFLMGFIDAETGLPAPSFDLWEERLGEHSYSSAAVYGGLLAAAEIAELLGKEGRLSEAWKERASSIRNAIVLYFWKPDWQRFIRSIRVKMNPWGEDRAADKVYMQLNPKGMRRDFTREDWTADICLLGLSIPFGVFEAGDAMMEGTVKMLEQVLAANELGGFNRYEFDTYAGGNPWIISTLWLALYHLEKKNISKAMKYFEWAVKSRTELGLLPEQVCRETGKPAWVIPLTWSHAMFVLVLDGLIKAGALK